MAKLSHVGDGHGRIINRLLCVAFLWTIINIEQLIDCKLQMLREHFSYVWEVSAGRWDSSGEEHFIVDSVGVSKYSVV